MGEGAPHSGLPVEQTEVARHALGISTVHAGPGSTGWEAQAAEIVAHRNAAYYAVLDLPDLERRHGFRHIRIIPP